MELRKRNGGCKEPPAPGKVARGGGGEAVVYPRYCIPHGSVQQRCCLKSRRKWRWGKATSKHTQGVACHRACPGMSRSRLLPLLPCLLCEGLAKVQMPPSWCKKYWSGGRAGPEPPN